MGGAQHGGVGRGIEVFGFLLAANKAARQLHRFHDLLVAGAAAQVVTQGLFDLIHAGVLIHIQQGLGRHDHARGAETALHRSGQYKGLLDEMGVVRGAQPLHRDDLGSVQFDGLGQTGAHRLAIHQHHAGAALALAVARLLGPYEIQVLA